MPNCGSIATYKEMVAQRSSCGTPSHYTGFGSSKTPKASSKFTKLIRLHMQVQASACRFDQAQCMTWALLILKVPLARLELATLWLQVVRSTIAPTPLHIDFKGVGILELSTDWRTCVHLNYVLCQAEVPRYAVENFQSAHNCHKKALDS